MEPMFEIQTQWTEAECHYVIATHRFRRAWLAGPYRTCAEAEDVLDKAVRWARMQSGDPDAAIYDYHVTPHFNGHQRTILGEIQP